MACGTSRKIVGALEVTMGLVFAAAAGRCHGRRGKELKLVVEAGGDGSRDDYAWWGEARFLRK